VSARTGLVVAIDGPSGSGKSSTSRGVALRLGLRYLDTGALYRAMTWWMLRHDVAVDDPEAVASRCGEPVIETGTDPEHPTITVDGADVAAAIRSTEVTDAVSPVSAVPQVRARLLLLQRAVIDGAADGPGIVVEGRDIGSVVAPDADLKVFLTADAGARAARRTAEEGGGDVRATESSLLARDRIDSTRIASPLSMAADAVHVDSTPYSLEEVVDLIVGLVEAAR
jgi:cytidylate kinase